MPAVRPYDLIDVLQHLNQTDQDQGALPDNPDEVVNTLVGPAFETLTVSDGTPMLTTASPTVYWGPLHYSNVILADNPAGYWRLGEASGTVAADSSGNSNTGTYTGGVTLGQAGALTGDSDTAALFNGSTGYVSTNLAGSTFTTLFGIEAWVKLTATNVGFWPIASAANNPLTDGWALAYDGNLQAFRFLANASTTDIHGTTAPVAGQWYYVAVSFDGATVRLFVNGTQEISAARTASLTSTATVALAFRRTVDSYFNGALDEVAIYPTALSAARVLAHYNMGKNLLTGGTWGLFQWN